MKQKMKIPAWYFLAALFAIMLLHTLWVEKKKVEILPYSDFQRYLEAGQVEEIVVTELHVYGTFKLPLANGKRRFSTIRVDPGLAKNLSMYNVKVTGATEQTFFTQILGWVLPAIVFVVIWIFFMRRLTGNQSSGGGGLMSIGKSKAKEIGAGSRIAEIDALIAEETAWARSTDKSKQRSDLIGAADDLFRRIVSEVPHA